jgi:hypothetical protein
LSCAKVYPGKFFGRCIVGLDLRSSQKVDRSWKILKSGLALILMIHPHLPKRFYWFETSSWLTGQPFLIPGWPMSGEDLSRDYLSGFIVLTL